MNNKNLFSRIKEVDWKKLLDKKYYKMYLAVLLGVTFVVAAVLAITLGGNHITPEETTPQTSTSITTPNDTTENTSTSTTPPTEPEPEPIPARTLTSVWITAGESPVEQLALSELQKHLEIKGVGVELGGFPIALLIDETLGDGLGGEFLEQFVTHIVVHFGEGVGGSLVVELAVEEACLFNVELYTQLGDVGGVQL